MFMFCKLSRLKSVYVNFVECCDCQVLYLTAKFVIVVIV